MTIKKCLWEILVPCKRNDGRPFHTRFHRIWDKRVKDITGGLTIMPVVKGQWKYPVDGTDYHEKMIPVRIVATEQEMDDIIDMTLKYYEQIAVLAYVISEKVVLRYAEGQDPCMN